VRQRLDQVLRVWAIAAFVAWVMLVAAAFGSTTNIAHGASASSSSAASSENATDNPTIEQRRDTPQTSVDEVSSTVMCPSCDTTLDQSNSPAAESMRVWVAEAVDAGWTEQEIRDGLVEEYDGDESILATPRAKGVGLLAFIVPALVVLTAAIGGFVLMRRWRGGSSADDHQTCSGSSSYSQSSASPSTSSKSSPSADEVVDPSPSSSR
jgi:cytochrome c-type biogenesis protein CcmH/NrfF